MRGDDAAAHHHDVASAEIFQRPDQVGDEGFVAGGLRANANHVDIRIDGLLGYFLWCLRKDEDTDTNSRAGETGIDMTKVVRTCAPPFLDIQSPRCAVHNHTTSTGRGCRMFVFTWNSGPTSTS